MERADCFKFEVSRQMLDCGKFLQRSQWTEVLIKLRDRVKCWIKYRLLGFQRTSAWTQRFWRDEQWVDYVGGIEKSEFLGKLIVQVGLPKTARILELGCNVGRNLHYLSGMGYSNLTGVELNREAVRNGLGGFHKLNRSIEDYFKDFRISYDLIFTMAVLEHLPEESEWIFNEMVRWSKYIVTIEDEKSLNKICFPRNYKKVFERLGMVQIRECSCEGVHPALTKDFRARIFAHQKHQDDMDYSDDVRCGAN